MELSPFFLAVRAVVNAEDPVGLLAFDCPEYEYDPEVKTLIKWDSELTGEQVAAVFVHYFGEIDGAMSADMAQRIASSVNEARRLNA